MSLLAIGRDLGLARNTIRRDLRLHVADFRQAQQDRSRSKRLNGYRDLLIHQLKAYRQLSVVKLARSLHERVGALPASDRSLRRYVRTLEEQFASTNCCYYESVLDPVPRVLS